MPDIELSWDAFFEPKTRFWATNMAEWMDALASAISKPVDAETLTPSNLALWKLGYEFKATDLVGAIHMRNAVTQKMGAGQLQSLFRALDRVD